MRGEEQVPDNGRLKMRIHWESLVYRLIILIPPNDMDTYLLEIIMETF